MTPPKEKALNTQLWPADKVQRWPTDKLIPAARNPRLHTKADIAVIADSIKRFGFTNPVLIDEAGRLIAGHGRVLAAKKLKIETVPVMVASGWSDDEKQAYLIADNQIAGRATWDDAMLQEELECLRLGGFDLSVVGFDMAALNVLLSSNKLFASDPEAVPPPPAKPISIVGDVWLLGNHRLMCGDCTDATAVALARGSYQPSIMVTDPPYGVHYDPGWRTGIDGKSARSLGKVLNDDRADWQEAWKLFPGSVSYIWHAGLFGGIVAESLTACNFEIRSQLVWVKQHFALGRGDYHWGHECCFYAIRKGAKTRWSSDRKQSTVWQFPNNGAFGTNPEREQTWGHGTQKPLEAMRRPIEHNSLPGDIVYDPFMGSGTTLIAAEMTGRICIGLELNPIYADVIVQRWSAFTDQTAIHAETGETFAQIAERRGLKVDAERGSNK